MKIFGNNITEVMWRQHLYNYGPSLFDNLDHFPLDLPPSIHLITPHSIYICPLCVSSYFIQSFNGVVGNAEFSIDHLPPASVGGKFKLLTCKKCNNKAGENEAELLKLTHFGTIPDKKQNSLFPKMRIQRKNSNEAFDISVLVSNNVADIKFNEYAKKHDPKLKQFLEDFHADKTGPLTIRVIPPDYYKIHKALLKSAYLICFVWWGYEFVSSEIGVMIRKVLNDEAEYPTVVPTLWLETAKYELPKGVGIVRKPDFAQCFYINMEIKNKAIDLMATVLIPNPSPDGCQKVTVFGEYLQETAGNKELEFFTLPIVVPKILNGYTYSWETFKVKSEH